MIAFRPNSTIVLSVLFDMLDDYKAWKADPKNQIVYSCLKHKMDEELDGHDAKKQKQSDLEEIICMPYKYIK